MKTLKEKFEDRIYKDPTCGCWLWTAGMMGGQKRYGGFHTEVGYRTAHRVSWEIHKGKIPIGLCVCHSCDTPLCVNPDHLFLGSHFDNMADCSEKKRNRTSRNVGTNHPLSKLDPYKVRDIRFLESIKFPRKQIAKSYDVTVNAIENVIWGKTWRHVGRGA